MSKRCKPYLFQCHSVLNQQRYPRIQVSYVFLEHEVLLGLGGDLGLQIAEITLSCGKQGVNDTVARKERAYDG